MRKPRSALRTWLFAAFAVVAAYLLVEGFSLPFAPKPENPPALPAGPDDLRQGSSPAVLPKAGAVKSNAVVKPESVQPTMWGHVRDSRGAPLAEVEVSVAGPSKERVVSDASGWYRLDNLKPGEYTLQAEKPGYDPLTETLQVTKGLNKDLVLTTTYGVLVKAFAAHTGAPLSCVELDLQPPAKALGMQSRKRFSESGEYSLAGLEAVPDAVTVASPGFKSQRYAGGKPDPDTRLWTLEARLQPADGIPGLVTDSAGAPVAGAYVLFGSMPAWDEVKENALTLSNVDGRFWVAAPPQGSWTVVACRHGYAPGYATRRATEPPGQLLTVVLPSPGALRGQVLNADGPYKDTPVTLTYPNEMPERQIGTRTDAEGRFSYDELAPGVVRARAAMQHPGGEIVGEADAVVTAGATAEVAIVLAPAKGVGGRVSGVVTRDGAPLAGANVTLAQSRDGGTHTVTAETDPAGAFVFADVFPGTATLTAQTEVDTDSTLQKSVSVSITQGARLTRNIEIADAGARISGTVTGASNTLFAAVVIYEGRVERTMADFARDTVDPGVRQVILLAMKGSLAETPNPKDTFQSEPLPPGAYTVFAVAATELPDGELSNVPCGSEFVNLQNDDVSVAFTVEP